MFSMLNSCLRIHSRTTAIAYSLAFSSYPHSIRDSKKSVNLRVSNFDGSDDEDPDCPGGVFFFNFKPYIVSV